MFRLVFIVLILACPLTAQELKRYDFSAPLMATTFRITLHAESKTQAETAAAAAFKRIAHLNTVFSDYEPNSELMQLCNAGPNTPFKASPALLGLLSRSLDLARLTDGAFDPTCGNLSQLWRRTKRVKKLPPTDRLAQALAATDWRAVQIDAKAQTITLTKPGMLLDLGGIAKGYAADEGLRILREHGLTRALVLAGGDIAIGDPPPGADAWDIKLRTFTKPTPDAEETMATVRLKNCGVSTSGDLYQFIDIEGTRYSHILSPKTGLALTTRIACSVIAPDCTTSDALATAMCVLGKERGEKVTSQMQGVTIRFAKP
ncbi:FAD:protein FMN transferase [Prosthecobacter sp.]|uniref:FAD:protein FMN transferase n=1 Tax=Prosthecobacter sp. TaxID=1965333 RepID=UPI002ABA6EC0|nr:FAD:protein FMN transferase [Prosthecobacter sp.]MDZ4405903.1 FAD:protein FMN transferase [Prosthecobacter sp.]